VAAAPLQQINEAAADSRCREIPISASERIAKKKNDHENPTAAADAVPRRFISENPQPRWLALAGRKFHEPHREKNVAQNCGQFPRTS